MKEIERSASIQPYTDKVERIYRVLLSRKKSGMSWYRIAKEAGAAFGWVDRVLTKLEEEGIIKGSAIKDPKALFEKWASRKDRRVYREYHIQEPEKILKKSGMDYALTGYFAENLIGHYLFPRYYELYIHMKDSARWHHLISENGYVGKGNLQIILADEHVFFESGKVDKWPTVSVQQLIVDLYREGAECTEAADMLLSKVYK